MYTHDMTDTATEVATLSIEGRIATLTLNRPDKRNALSRELIAALHAHADSVRTNPDVSVLLLRGAGRSFCAGMDLKAVLKEPGAPLELLSGIAELTILLRTMPQVVVADVRGAAIGGGCGLVAVADLSITHPDAKLGYPEVDLGVCPAVVAPWLVQSIGAGPARRVLLQGGTMSGQRAYELGLVSQCVPADEMDEAIEALTARLARAGVVALGATKGLLSELEADRIHALVRAGAKVSADVIASDEAQERLAKIYG
ncbi:MAG: enoyl-CoA hydratase-related protein [Phycisphaerales bacterium]